MHILFLTFLTVLIVAAREVPQDGPIDMSNRYIVSLKTSADLDKHLELVQTLHDAASKDGEPHDGITYRYSIPTHFKGYAGHFSKSVIDHLQKEADVDHIEEDLYLELKDQVSNIHVLDQPESGDAAWRLRRPIPLGPKGTSLVAQPNAPYNLAMISHRSLNLQEGYVYVPAPPKTETFAYVVDSGILASHPELQGRVRKGHNSALSFPFDDLVGHGTHVAAIIGGRTYGVMKTATLIDVKVFGRTGGPTSQLLDGYQWAVRDIAHKRQQARSVINISAGGAHKSYALSLAVRAGWFRGVSTAVAAGNTGDTSKWTSNAINVGAVSRNRHRAHFSCYGRAVTLFAPGVNVASAWAVNGRPALAMASGTSQAAPHAAGMVLYLKAQTHLPNALLTKRALVGLATKGVVEDARSANLLLYNGSGR